MRALQIELEFESVGFEERRKLEYPEEKPLGARKRTNNILNPHIASTQGFEAGETSERLHATAMQSIFNLSIRPLFCEEFWSETQIDELRTYRFL